MAKKTTDEEEANVATQEEESTTTQEPAATATAPIPGTIYLVNSSRMKITIPLTDGTHVQMGPKASGHNVSRVFPKKLLPPHARRLASATGPLTIVDAVTGGAK